MLRLQSSKPPPRNSVPHTTLLRGRCGRPLSTTRLPSSSSVSSESFLSAAQTSYDSSLDAYKYGVRSLVDVVQAERQLAQARLATVSSYAQLMQSAVSLGYAVGDMLHGNPPSQGVHP